MKWGEELSLSLQAKGTGVSSSGHMGWLSQKKVKILN